MGVGFCEGRNLAKFVALGSAFIGYFSVYTYIHTHRVTPIELEHGFRICVFVLLLRGLCRWMDRYNTYVRYVCMYVWKVFWSLRFPVWFSGFPLPDYIACIWMIT